MARRIADSISPAYLAKHLAYAPATPPRPGQTRGNGERAEAALYASLALLGIEHEPQYRWGRLLTPPRGFHSDAGIPAARLLIELDGQVHAIRDKRARDLERQNLGVLAGFAFLRFLPAQAEDGSAALMVKRWLEERAWHLIGR